MTSIRPHPLAAAAVLAVATGLPAVAAENDAAPASNQAPGGVQELLRGIRGMQRLSVAGVQMVDAGERVLFVSDNGRYVFTGPAWDLMARGEAYNAGGGRWVLRCRRPPCGRGRLRMPPRVEDQLFLETP
jgi:hypothetical protein